MALSIAGVLFPTVIAVVAFAAVVVQHTLLIALMLCSRYKLICCYRYV